MDTADKAPAHHGHRQAALSRRMGRDVFFATAWIVSGLLLASQFAVIGWMLL